MIIDAVHLETSLGSPCSEVLLTWAMQLIVRDLVTAVTCRGFEQDRPEVATCT
jgi:hypothetical protein